MPSPKLQIALFCYLGVGISTLGFPENDNPLVSLSLHRSVSLSVAAEANGGDRAIFTNPAVGQQLAAADQLAAQGDWTEALPHYLRLIESGDSEVVAVEPGHYLQVRLVCQQRIARAPAAVLQRYRDRVDHRAREWFEQGQAKRDLRLLWRVVDEAFCSSVGDEALDRLGDLLFEQGRFAEAEAAWRQIADLPGSDPSIKPLLVYPDTKLDVARMRAKQLLARWFRGDEEAFAEGLALFQKEHDTAEGNLAGKSGKYIAILREVAGSGSRDQGLGIRHQGPQSLVLHRSVPLSAAAARPLIIGNKVVLADAQRVWVIDIRSGVQTEWYRLPERLAVAGVSDPGYRPSPLTFDQGRLFVCLGRRWLVCLDVDAGGRVLWRASSPGKDDSHFEGAPLVVNDRVYVSVTSQQGETIAEVACYHAPSGALLWRQKTGRMEDWKVGRTPPISQPSNLPSFQPSLLLAGRYIISNTGLGAVAALHPDTGRVVWAVAYGQRRAPEAEAEISKPMVACLRDPNPCLYSDGLVFVAARDDGRLRCLDAATGRSLWQTPELEVCHLLGVAGKRLVVTTPRDIRAVDVRTGTVRWRQPRSAGVPPAPGGRDARAPGRGFLAGQTVYWPTRDGLRILDVNTGEQVIDPQRLKHIPPGDLIWDAGWLVVAIESRMLMYGRAEGKMKADE